MTGPAPVTPREAATVAPRTPTPDIRPDRPGPVLTAQGADNRVRWRPGERLHHLFEQRCDRFAAEGDPGHLAVDDGERRLTFAELDARANQFARLLRARGVRPGDRVGLLLDRSASAYLAMLAVSKIHAVYVPVDAGFPADRIGFVLSDAGVETVVTLGSLADRLDGLPGTVILLDTSPDLDHYPCHRIGPHELRRGEVGRDELDPDDPGPGGRDLAYLIYTSGSTGRPKGVAIDQANICNFVRVAVECYGLRPEDRVYQGMTIAFDFSVEEIWVPLVAGATLVPSTAPGALVGSDLADFLARNRVTALCCVPTLLATIEEELPQLRFVLVSGEACPARLVDRWHRPGRTLLNVYGPTETSVTATWSRLEPGRPVTIGVPLPTYSVVILDSAQRLLPVGATGEIGVAGIGLSPGYVNRPDLTARAFVPDTVGIPDNPSGRIYRTGDLGRITPDGQLEYLGRIDSQVKVRGYRIELTEIESVLLRLPEVAQAAVTTYQPEPGVVELAAFYTRRGGADALDPAAALAALRGRLPGYMVPAYLEELPELPTLPSDKVDRKRLPAPSGPRTLPTTPLVAPVGKTESALADLLADLLRVDRVSVRDDFFTDLGADSLVMSRYCARLRERLRVDVSIKDVYLHPTVRALAVVVAAEVPPAPPEPARPAHRVPSDLEWYGCAVFQTLFGLGYVVLLAAVVLTGYNWITDGSGAAGFALRSLGFGVAWFVALAVLPVALKWLLVGRWRAGTFPIWGLRYLRFWVVKRMIRANPLVLFAGSPVYNLYLRALGAKVGPGALVLSRSVPVCTDLVEIGAGTVVGKGVSFSGYRAEAGWITTGPVRLGRNANVGEGCVLDLDTVLGDGAHLGHASSPRAGQVVPAGARFHGSPAVPGGSGNPAPEPRRCSAARRGAYGVVQLAGRVVLDTQLLVVLAALAFALDVSTVPGSTLMYLGGFLLAALLVLAVPRLANLFLTADRVYPLYGWRWICYQTVSRFSNVPFFNLLFGDSSYVVGYLRAVGWRFRQVRQTGSNFGCGQKHDTPFLCEVRGGVLVSDGLSMGNARYSPSSFALSQVTINAENFLGNRIIFPAGARVGDDCLLATKVMVPIDGPVRSGVGLLGSPPFEIPRSVRRDTAFDAYRSGDEFRRRLARKNRSNVCTMGWYLLSGWLLFHLAIQIVVRVEGIHDGARPNLWTFSAGIVLAVLTIVGYSVLVDWLCLGFRRLRPLHCSIYDPRYWRHERYWKLTGVGHLGLFNGTPLKPMLLRLHGVRVGRRVFDDGCGMPERTLVEIGDHCTLSEGSTLHSHSLEDGSFKTDRIRLGSGCSVGTGALVHYGVELADGVLVAPDSFVMKGSSLPSGTVWRGNPARQVPAG
ncbi:amino acid adenylation domain-containing protein [Micromonospora sp. WMMD1102]|uniref:Pls/PosA family non-ribosomal peptide synthetase n=1 Tax=Micromonospora sp. WMMD1102 TaxID=3016105 RepID=UPI002414E880|nr:Pls/PosA family non-ribosomal peptide synthetase [Micromonospora sp. WMMD1102]MDG4786628.1 amino acid adenylation domain-containing protein [Micromonospora sp. WMMD1102]